MPIRATCLGPLACATLMTVLPSLPALADFPPERTENLQVLPADTDVREVVDLMRSFTFALGVRCEHCHVGEPGQPLSTFDFASDEKEAKRTARLMIRMVEAINETYLAEVAAGPGGRRTVACGTCHHGLTRPDTLAAALTRAKEEGGAAAAVAKYRELRQEYHGTDSYDFSEWTLLDVADSMLRAGDPESAGALIELNLEHFPDSPTSVMFQARFHHLQGRSERAIEILRNLLAAHPDDARARQLLDQIEQPAEE